MEDAKLYRDFGGNEYFGSGEDIEWPEDPDLAKVGEQKVVGDDAEEDLELAERERENEIELPLLRVINSKKEALIAAE
jgi:hypothetical protein